MTTLKPLTFEEWEDKYQPLTDKNDDCPISFETYGDDLVFVMSKKNETIWTVVEVDNGDLHIIPGYHLCNRIGYFITEKPWEDKNISAIYLEYGEFEWDLF